MRKNPLQIDQRWPSQNEEQYTLLFWFCSLRHALNPALTFSFPQFSLLIPIHSVFAKIMFPAHDSKLFPSVHSIYSFSCSLKIYRMLIFFFLFIANDSCHKQPDFTRRQTMLIVRVLLLVFRLVNVFLLKYYMETKKCIKY